MAYEPKQWQNYPSTSTPITAGELNRMEQGIQEASHLASLGKGPNELITELARRDGWMSVYDPTDSNTTSTDSQGRITSLSDSLGNLPELIPTSAGKDIKLLPGEFGQLSGMSGGSLRSRYEFTGSHAAHKPQHPLTVMSVARGVEGTTNRFLYGGPAGDASFRDDRKTINYMSSGSLVPGRTPHDLKPHIFEHIWDSTESSYFKIDGELDTRGGKHLSPIPPWRFFYGCFNSSGGSPWGGELGTLLFYDGEPPREVLNRMRKLLMTLTGITPPPPRFNEESRVMTLDGKDNIVQLKGDPDSIYNETIASITKLTATLMLRHFIPTSRWNEDVTMRPEAKFGVANEKVSPGDTVSWKDAVSFMAKNSDNNVSQMIAREIYDRFLSDKYPESEGWTYHTGYLQEAEDLFNNEFGYPGAAIRSANIGGQMSLRHVAKMLREIVKDPVMRECYSSDDIVVQIKGENPRTDTASHRLLSPSGLPFIARKTGSSGIRDHIVVAWENPLDGQTYITVILDLFIASSRMPSVNEYPNNREEELEVAQESLLSENRFYSRGTVYLAGSPVKTTNLRDIKHLVDGASSGTINMVRTDSSVMLVLEDATFDSQTANLELPEGYRPAVTLHNAMVGDDGSESKVRIGWDGSVTLSNLNTGEGYNLVLNWLVPGEYSMDFPNPPYIGRSRVRGTNSNYDPT